MNVDSPEVLKARSLAIGELRNAKAFTRVRKHAEAAGDERVAAIARHRAQRAKVKALTALADVRRYLGGAVDA